MKIGVTITKCIQTGMDTYKDLSVTKVFESSASVDSIMDWAKTIKEINFNELQFSLIAE